jgi:hypothetical protein
VHDAQAAPHSVLPEHTVPYSSSWPASTAPSSQGSPEQASSNAEREGDQQEQGPSGVPAPAEPELQPAQGSADEVPLPAERTPPAAAKENRAQEESQRAWSAASSDKAPWQQGRPRIDYNVTPMVRNA